MGWTVNFKSYNGTTCRIDINGGGTALTGAANPVEFQEDQTDDLLQVIRTTTGNINIEETSVGQLDALYPVTNKQNSVQVFYGSRKIFDGYMQAQSFDNVWTSAKHVVTFPIQSKLGVAGSTYLQPFKPFGNTTLGTILKGICTDLGYNAVVLPFGLLPDTGNGSPNALNVKVNNRMVCPFNTDFKFGTNDAFKPMSYSEYIESVCRLFGLIAHDSFDASGNSILLFTRFDYDGNYRRISTADLDDPSEQGINIYRQAVDFGTNFFVSDNNGRKSCVLPLGKIEIDYGEYLEDVDMKLWLATLGDHPGSREGGLINVGDVMYLLPLSRNDGGEFYSRLWSDSTVLYSSYSIDMVRVAGDGNREMIDISFRHSYDPPSDDPLFEYTFGEIPRTKFGIIMRTLSHSYPYRLQVTSGSQYLALDTYGQAYWRNTATFVNFTYDENGDYSIADIPAVTDPVTVKLYQHASVYTYFGDPVTQLSLKFDVNPLNKYLECLLSPIQTIKQEGSENTASIDAVFHDHIDNPGRIIGDTLADEPDYAYLLNTQMKLTLTGRNKVENPLDMLALQRGTFTINGTSGWKLTSIGFEPWSDDIKFVFMKETSNS